MVICMYLLGIPHVDNHIKMLQRYYNYPSLRISRCWIQRFNENHHILPFQRIGNMRATQEVTGLAMANLDLIRFILLKSRLYEEVIPSNSKKLL